MNNKERGEKGLGIGRLSLSLCLLFLFLSFAGNLWAQPTASTSTTIYAYRIQSNRTNFTNGYIYATSGNGINTGNNTNDISAYWYFEPTGSTNQYYIRSLSTGKYMKAINSNTGNTNVIELVTNKENTNNFKFNISGTNNTAITTELNSGVGLNLYGGNAIGDGICFWDANDPGSKWNLTNNTDIQIYTHTPTDTISVSGASGNGIQLVKPTNFDFSYTYFTFNSTNYYQINGEHTTSLPNFASATYSWSIASGSEYATISTDGVLTSKGVATTMQTVTVKLTATVGGKNYSQTARIGIQDHAEVPATLTLSGPTVINQVNQSQPVQANWSGYYTPAYTDFKYNYNDHHVHNGTIYPNVPTLYSLEGCTLTWSLIGEGASYASVANGSSSSASVTYETEAPQDVVVGVMCNVTHSSYPGLSIDAGPHNITLYSTTIAPPVINYEAGNNFFTINSILEGSTKYTLDGSDPDYYSGPGTEYSGAVTLTTSPTTVKAVTERWGHVSDIAERTIYLTCPTPTITITSGSVSISSSLEGVTIYYTTDGSTPTTSSSVYSAGFTVPLETIVKAIATKTDWLQSAVAMNEYSIYTTIYSLSEITNLNGMYHLSSDITVTEGSDLTGFAGTLDGRYYKIIGLTEPMFNSINGATIKNLVLEDVTLDGNISVGGTSCLGAIAGKASGTSKIYNCGIIGTSSVSGGDNVGSLVGYIEGNTRVINNYSYANVSGAQYVGGIVGRNNGTALSNSNATSTTTAHTAVANNIFYGNLSGTSNVSPVYGGNHTSNVQNVNEYNFWRTRADVTYNNYNDQLAIDKDEFLNRFPFYRHILNTHRELAAIYLFGSASTTNVAEIGHWYNLPNSEAMEAKIPYMILQPWPSNTTSTPSRGHNNVDLPNTTENYAGRLLTEMGGTSTNAGYLKVNMSINGTSVTDYLPITDMDTNNFDYTWGKVKLPFVNEYSGWTRDYDYICTGWKITSVTGGTTGTFSNYNFADRNCTAKDIYTMGGFAFAQGGNYIVPYGVTEINMTANFARAYYLRDATYDVSYNNTYTGATGVCGNVSGTTYHGKTIYTDIESALNAMSTTDDVHAQAIVLVGNYHYNQDVLGNNNGFPKYTGKGLTIMSVDEDNNQEPDYGFYLFPSGDNTSTGRTTTPPLRFDFVPLLGLGMSARVTGSQPYPFCGIWYPKGWFEYTETSLVYTSECELQAHNFASSNSSKNRWIANSGYFEQVLRTRKQDEGETSYLRYIQIGGNAYVKQLYPGSHTDKQNTVTLCPINVTGGEIVDCFMTGYYAGAQTYGGIYFWCSGGKIHKYLSSYLEKPAANINVTAQVDHAYIYRFFGGGTSASAPITGNINVTINNSFVQFYCGGPEFGNMSSGKTVTTNATGTTFGEFYGAGFGGNSYTLIRDGQAPSPNFGETSVTFPIYSTNYFNSTRLAYTDVGFGVGYDFEFFMWAGGKGTGVARTYTKRVNFSLAKVPTVTSNLTDCVVLGNFCGGGCQGQVDNGNVNSNLVTSTLNNCTVYGSVFGAGYKAPATTVEVYPTTQPGFSTYIKEQGVFTDFDYSGIETETYTWVAGTGTTANQTNKTLPSGLTQNDLDNLGYVNGNVTLTINNSEVRGSVFGGGNESKTMGNTHVTVKGNTHVFGNVYGGGNAALVGGNTHVDIGGE